MGEKLAKTIDWYNQHAEEYAKSIHEHPKNASLFFSHLKGTKILDAGCGPGYDCSMLKRMGLEPTGADLSESFINVARQKNPDLTFIQGDLLSLPFSAQSFDGVWAHASLLHLETINDVRKALSEFHRVLTPAGILLVRVKKQEGRQKTITTEDGRFFRFFAQDELGKLINESGFKVLASEEQPSSRMENEARIMVIARKGISTVA